MTRSASPSRPANRLLASLPRADLARLTLSLEQVDLSLGEHLHDPGSPQEHFYFPGTSIVSLIQLPAPFEHPKAHALPGQGALDEHRLTVHPSDTSAIMREVHDVSL